MRKLFILLFLTLAQVMSAQTIKGVVVDEETGDTIPKTGVQYKNSNISTACDKIAAKKRTDLSNHDYYQFNKYQKLTFAINDISPAQLENEKTQKKQWLINQIEVCQYNNKLILPLSVDETVTQNLFRKDPKNEKTIVLGQNTTGVNDLIQTGDVLNTVIKDVFTDVDIYDDQIRLLQYPFTSPIGKDAIDFYRFYIVDTLYVDNDECYHLQFVPNNQQDFGFRGELWVLTDTTLHVKKCKLTLPKKTDVNFTDNLSILQEYTKLPNGEWALTTDDMIVEMSVVKFMTKFIVIRTTRMSNYAFNKIPDREFKGKAKIKYDPNSKMRDDDFWATNRMVHLTNGESSMSSFITGLSNTKGFKYILFGLKALIENFVETGKKSYVDIGPINTMISTNFIDGLRTRLSAQTTANLSPHFFLSGYYARGWKSHKDYYKGQLTYSFNKKEYMPWEFPKRTITFTSTYDVCSPSDKFMPTDKDNVFTAFKWTEVDKMMFYNRQELAFEYEQYWGLKTTVKLKTEENEACGSLYFKPLATNGGASVNRIRTTEASFQLRYSPGETYVNTKQRRLRVNFDPPVFTISHTVGVKGVLGGDYDYNLTE